MEEIDLKEMFKEFWNRRMLIISIILIGFVIIGCLFLIPKKEQKTYTATTTILITKEIDEEEKENTIVQDANIIMALIKSDIMMEEIKNSIKIDSEKDNIIASSEISNIISVNVTEEKKEDAINVSNVIIEKLKTFDFIKNNNINLQFVDFPEKSCKENIAIGNRSLILFVIPVVTAFGVVFIMYIFDTTVKSKDKLEKELNINVIDELKVMKKENNSIENELTTIFDFKSENSKIFKIITAKLLNNINISEQNVLLISSVNDNEGKTYVSSNIGTVLAMFGKKVIILDANFEESKLDKIFKIPNTLGLSNYLTGMNRNGQETKETLNNFIQETDIKNLNIITSGDVKENVTNCLVSERFDEFIKQLKFYYDFIIIDSDKMLNTPNSLILSNKANNTIVVVNRNLTKIEDLVKVNNDIKEVGGNLLGVIINETNKECFINIGINNLKDQKKDSVLKKEKNNKLVKKIDKK